MIFKILVVFFTILSSISQAADHSSFTVTDKDSLEILKERLALGNIKTLKLAKDSYHNIMSGS
jgi:uncharacterized membrane protein